MNRYLGSSVNRPDPSFSEKKPCWDILGTQHAHGKPGLSGRTCSDLRIPGAQRNNRVLTTASRSSECAQPASKFAARIWDSLPHGINRKWVGVSPLQWHSVHTRLRNLGQKVTRVRPSPLPFPFAFFAFSHSPPVLFPPALPFSPNPVLCPASGFLLFLNHYQS